jgi:hypothetical protein
VSLVEAGDDFHRSDDDDFDDFDDDEKKKDDFSFVSPLNERERERERERWERERQEEVKRPLRFLRTRYDGTSSSSSKR